MTIATKDNRGSAKFAASLMEALCPSHRDRTLILRQLLESIDVAAKISSNIWAVTLFDQGFRLNVGQVEVMTFKTMVLPQSAVTLVELRLLLHGEVNDVVQAVCAENEDVHDISPSHYVSVSQPQFVYTGLGDISNGSLTDKKFQELADALELLQPMHANFIAQAARTLGGGIRKSSSFHRSHSPGLKIYAESLVSGIWKAANQQDAPALVEGGVFSVQATVYERNSMARQKCIVHYGLSCSVCGFCFGVIYGNAAKDYVHVHHLKPMATIGKEYVIDPINDLRPVCANCHSVIHLRQPPYSIEEVKSMLHGRADF